MQIVRFELSGERHWGVLEGPVVTQLDAFAWNLPPHQTGRSLKVADVRLVAPIDPPRNVFCLGRNYAEHAREDPHFVGDLPKAPIWFSKAPTCVSDPEADVVIDPALTAEVDWEVELAVVIGKGGKRIPVERALSHVFGYTVVNDLSPRDLQFGRGGQWYYGKSLDGLLPAGPVLVTADQVPDPQSLVLRCRVNGDERQHGRTSDMIFSVAEAISDLSRGIGLLPGDVIATGTPSGVGMGRTPPLYLSDGNIVECEVEGIGVLRNRIRFVTP